MMKSFMPHSGRMSKTHERKIRALLLTKDRVLAIKRIQFWRELQYCDNAMPAKLGAVGRM